MAALDASAAAIVCYHRGVKCSGPVRQTLICQRGAVRPGSEDFISTLPSEAAVSLGQLGGEGPRIRPGYVWTNRVPAQVLGHRLCAVLAVEEDHVTVLELDRPLDARPSAPRRSRA